MHLLVVAGVESFGGSLSSRRDEKGGSTPRVITGLGVIAVGDVVFSVYG